MKKITDEAVAQALVRNLSKEEVQKTKKLFVKALKVIEAETRITGGSTAQDDRDYFTLDAIVKQLPEAD